jgi:hypothetical protein
MFYQSQNSTSVWLRQIVSGQEMFNLTCISFLYFWVEYIIDLVAIYAVTCLKSTLNIDSEILRIIGNREYAYPKGKRTQHRLQTMVPTNT